MEVGQVVEWSNKGTSRDGTLIREILMRERCTAIQYSTVKAVFSRGHRVQQTRRLGNPVVIGK